MASNGTQIYIMSCYDWAAGKSLCYPVHFRYKLYRAVCLAGLKYAGASGEGLGRGIAKEELGRELGEMERRRRIMEGVRRGGLGERD